MPSPVITPPNAMSPAPTATTPARTLNTVTTSALFCSIHLRIVITMRAAPSATSVSSGANALPTTCAAESTVFHKAVKASPNRVAASASSARMVNPRSRASASSCRMPRAPSPMSGNNCVPDLPNTSIARAARWAGFRICESRSAIKRNCASGDKRPRSFTDSPKAESAATADFDPPAASTNCFCIFRSDVSSVSTSVPDCSAA